MEQPRTGAGTAEIFKDHFCGECGWPVIECCNNDEMFYFKDASEWDWWLYCSNKGCKNHEGEGWFQYVPEWVKKIIKEEK